jgi:putative transposase
MVTAPARREVVRTMVTRGLSERHALMVVDMSASSLRYIPAPDRNVDLRARIVALAHRHRRYGAGMIYLKLRQAGERANHKRVDRLYAEERLHIHRRRRKKVPVADRQPLVLGLTRFRGHLRKGGYDAKYGQANRCETGAPAVS